MYPYMDKQYIKGNFPHEGENLRAAQLGPQEYISKEQIKRTVFNQIQFNTERISVLEKELHELGAMLIPYTAPMAEKEGSQPGLNEPMSEVVSMLVDQSAYLDRLAYQVRQLRSALQL